MLLTESQLSRLHRALHDTPVLSVYVERPAANPAERHAHRVRLVKALDELRASLAGREDGGRADFERSVTRLNALIDLREPLLQVPGPGWVTFITADAVQLEGAVPAPMPTLVRWQHGIWATPYLRALKTHRQVLVTMIDNEQATIHRYLHGAMAPISKVHVHPHGGAGEHLGKPPRGGFHRGTRGSTAMDASAGARIVARTRLVHELVQQLAELTDGSGFLLVGGSTTAAAALMRSLPPALARRTRRLPPRGRVESPADLQADVARGVRALREAEDLVLVGRIAEQVGAHGAAVAGTVAVTDAVASGRAREVVLTERFLSEHVAESENVTELALEHGTSLEIVTGSASERLDECAGGIAAQLRFVARPAAPLVAAG